MFKATNAMSYSLSPLIIKVDVETEAFYEKYVINSGLKFPKTKKM
jgi:hypothetical protein